MSTNEARAQALQQYIADNPGEPIDRDDFEAGWNMRSPAALPVPADIVREKPTRKLIADLLTMESELRMTMPYSPYAEVIAEARAALVHLQGESQTTGEQEYWLLETDAAYKKTGEPLPGLIGPFGSKDAAQAYGKALIWNGESGAVRANAPEGDN